MAALTWTDTLALDQPVMDQTHREFVDLLSACEAVRDGEQADLLDRFDTLVRHTVAHFAQEDRWMQATGFAADNCHAFQHRAVLEVMQGCAERARDAGDFQPLLLAVAELATWFPQHAQMMDAALVQHMAEVGFDPASATPRQAPTGAGITGCGVAACST